MDMWRRISTQYFQCYPVLVQSPEKMGSTLWLSWHIHIYILYLRPSPYKRKQRTFCILPRTLTWQQRTQTMDLQNQTNFRISTQLSSSSFSKHIKAMLYCLTNGGGGGGGGGEQKTIHMHVLFYHGRDRSKAPSQARKLWLSLGTR